MGDKTNRRQFFALSHRCRRNFAVNLQIARLHKDFSQHNLARMLGGSQSEISRWERGVVVPSLIKILTLQHVLNADLLSSVIDLYEREMALKEGNE